MDRVLEGIEKAIKRYPKQKEECSHVVDIDEESPEELLWRGIVGILLFEVDHP